MEDCPPSAAARKMSRSAACILMKSLSLRAVPGLTAEGSLQFRAKRSTAGGRQNAAVVLNQRLWSP